MEEIYKFQKLKDYIKENTVKSVNEKKKQLYVYKYIIPKDDFRDIMFANDVIYTGFFVKISFNKFW